MDYNSPVLRDSWRFDSSRWHMKKGNLVKRLKEIGVMHKEKVVLRSGKTSDFYCDIKKAFGYPDILNALADEIGALIPTQVTCIAGSGYGGLPLGSIVASRFNKKFVAVRSSIKNYGKEGKIEGYIPTKNDVVVVVDDVLTTGSSIKETLSALEKIGAKVFKVVVAVKRGDPELPIPFSFVFTIDEILEN